MSVNVWCDDCGRRFPVSELDMQTRTCDVCRGTADNVVSVGDQPLTDAEKATSIDVDVWVSESWTMTADEGWSPQEWRDMLEEVANGTADKEVYIQDAALEKEVTLTLRGPLAEKFEEVAKSA